MKNSPLCPCFSHQSYEKCCKDYHEGKLAENALKLMRSRFAAYALGLTDYLIQTTHPDNPAYSSNKLKWKEEILLFCHSTQFEGLEIVEFNEGLQEAYVTFNAYLSQNGINGSFREKSKFLKINGSWFYHSYLTIEKINILSSS